MISTLSPGILTPEQVQKYHTEGFVVEQMLTSQDLKPVEEAIDELTQKALASPEAMSEILELEPEKVDGRAVPRRIFNPYDQHVAFEQLARNERLMASIASLIGPDFNLQHSKLNMKPARVGSIVEWHQDLAYFPHTNDDLVTMLIYLDDATVENGCLQVLPRHHHHFFSHNDVEGQFLGKISENLDDARYGRPIPLSGRRGSVIFMHCLTPHSSLPNSSSSPRRTLIFEYRAADSFPIYYGEMTASAEARQRPLSGRPAQHARFGGPPPLIPHVGRYSSLYDLQSRSSGKENS